jgi:hypothetical protein
MTFPIISGHVRSEINERALAGKSNSFLASIPQSTGNAIRKGQDIYEYKAELAKTAFEYDDFGRNIESAIQPKDHCQV